MSNSLKNKNKRVKTAKKKGNITITMACNFFLDKQSSNQEVSHKHVSKDNLSQENVRLMWLLMHINGGEHLDLSGRCKRLSEVVKEWEDCHRANFYSL